MFVFKRVMQIKIYICFCVLNTSIIIFLVLIEKNVYLQK